MPTQRLWRKTLRDNDGNGTFGDGQDGVDPNRNYPTAWNLDEEGASNTFSSGTYRGPFPLSEPEDLAYDRLLRRITPEAVINYHSAAQLLLYPFGYITDVYADDDPWFKAITGTDGDAAVDPYISQRSSDLYITNGETTDHAYNKYGSMSWTPELDECETAAGGTFCSGGSGFTFPDDEGKVEAVFEKNLDFARNVAATTLDRDRPDRPRNATDDETQYQVKASPDIEPNRFNVSYGADPDARGDDAPDPRPGRLRRPGRDRRRRRLAHADARGASRGRAASASATSAASTTSACGRDDPGGLRPARDGADAAAAGRGRRGQRPRHRGLAAAAVLLPRASPRGRPATPSACSWSRPRTTRASRPTRRRTTTRRATSTRTSRRSRPTATPSRRTTSTRRRPGRTARRLQADLRPRRALALRRRPVLHRRRPAPAGGRPGRRRTTNYRRLADTPNAQGAFALTGSQHLTTVGRAQRADAAQLHERGRQGVFTGRNGWVQQTSTGTGLTTYSGYSLVAGARVRLRLPAGPGGRRRPSAHGVLP